ncbi:MAG: hypothetical protein AAF846_27780 [Chloroflexota bacterium]
MAIRDWLDSERIEQLSVFALVLGILFIFQWWTQSLYSVGLALLIIGSVGTLASQVMQKRKIVQILERLSVVGMMVGIAGMLQPWQIWLYENGFYLLLIATVGFIILSHMDTSEV